MTEDVLRTGNVADLTLERVRRLEMSLERLKVSSDIQNQKLDALMDLAAGTRADFAGFMKVDAAQDARLGHIEKYIERIKTRLDITD